MGFGGEIAWHGLLTDARQLKVRFNNHGKLAGWVVVDGTYLEFDGERVFRANHPVDLIFDGVRIRAIEVNEAHRIESSPGYSEAAIHLPPLASWLARHKYGAEDLDAILVPKSTGMVTLREAFLLGEDPHDPHDVIVPAMTSVDRDRLGFSFRSRPGFHYQLEMSTDLMQWSPHSAPMESGEGADQTLLIDTGEGGARFFRLRISAPSSLNQ